ncbi:MAG: ABC transporter permease [Cytophagales bacterium]|nr:ABC transporter permease [Cytophagales bacterium]
MLTPYIVKKYFGDTDPIGKTIRIDINGEKSYTVSGIIEAALANSSIHYEFYSLKIGLTTIVILPIGELNIIAHLCS